MLPVFSIVACGVLFASSYRVPIGFLLAGIGISGLLAAGFRSGIHAALLLLFTAAAVTELGFDAPEPPADEYRIFRLRIPEEPVPHGRIAATEAAVEAWCDAQGQWHASRSRVRLLCDSTWRPQAGERLCARGRIRPFSGSDSRYASAVRRRGCLGTLRLGRRDLLQRDTLRIALPPAFRLHATAADRIDRLELNPESRAVVQAMAVGERRYLTPELRRTYARSGASHLLAVSGLHVGVVFLLVNALLWLLPLVRGGHRIRNLAAVAFVWLYAFTAGCSPSVVRAACMFSALQFALAFRLEYTGLNLLCGVAAAMVLIHPPMLFDIGFQLSFLSAGAILCWAVPAMRLLRGGFLRWTAGSLLVGFCAAAVTLPLVSHRFGIVPLGGVLLNPLLLLTAQAIVVPAVFWLCLPAECLRIPVGWLLEGAVRLQNGMAEAVAAREYAAVDFRLPTEAVIGIYLVFCLFTLAAWSAERKKSVSLSDRYP